MTEWDVNPDYPSVVHLETWAKCNAACVFCPYPILDRQGIRMSDALIEKILMDLEDFPKNHPFFISPFKVNEPFLDNRLLDILEDINRRLPNAFLKLFSNGTPLTGKKLDRIESLSNVVYLWISLNDHRPIEYEATMKLPLKKTIKRLDLLHAKKKAGGFRHRVMISKVIDGTSADNEFYGCVKSRYPLFEIVILKRESWIDFHEHDAIPQEVPQRKCGRWSEIDITSTGVVSLCCMDGMCQYPIGDVSKQHVLEVFNSPGYSRMRNGTQNRQAYDPCNRCTY